MNYKKFKAFEKRALDTVYSEDPGSFHDDIIPGLVDRFLPELGIQTHHKILDIGCGPGVFLQAVKNKGYNNVTGVTLSQQDAEFCIANGHDIIMSSMTDLPIEDETVDLIWCRHALEHSPYPLFTLYEFDRILRPDGVMFIEVPAPDNVRMDMHEFNPNHYSILGGRMWMALFNKVNLEAVNHWHYDIDLIFDELPVNERSLMFAVKKYQSN